MILLQVMIIFQLSSNLMVGLENAKKHGYKSAETLLKLQTMEERIFLETNQITPDKNKFRHLKQYDIFSTKQNIISNLANSIGSKTFEIINKAYLDYAK